MNDFLLVRSQLTGPELVTTSVWRRALRLSSRSARAAWTVSSVTAEPGETTAVALTAPAGTDFAFQPGQFAWFAIGRSPFSLIRHPFSFSSSAERGEAEVAIKARATSPRPSARSNRARASTSTARTALSRSILMTRPVWLIATLIVVACVLFAAAQS